MDDGIAALEADATILNASLNVGRTREIDWLVLPTVAWFTATPLGAFPKAVPPPLDTKMLTCAGELPIDGPKLRYLEDVASLVKVKPPLARSKMKEIFALAPASDPIDPQRPVASLPDEITPE